MTLSAVESVCPFCGPSLVHVETGRCQKCGRAARAPGLGEPVNRNGTTPVPASAKAEPFKLPNSTRTRTWLEQARTLRDSFVAMAEKSDAQAKTAQDEATRYRKAASVFDQLLTQVDVDAGGQIKPTQRRRSRAGEWSSYSAACLQCGKSDVRHVARGYCKKCYDRVRPAKRNTA